MDNEAILAIRRLKVKYLGEKITRMADKIWEEKGWTDEDMDKLLQEHKRTKYNPHNK